MPLQAAIRHVVARRAGREAFKGPEKQNRHHQANRDVKSTSHLAPRVSLPVARPDAKGVKFLPWRCRSSLSGRPGLLAGQVRGVFLVLDTNKIQQIGVELDDLV
jgi:hypothetical protein